jgi:hypothetical protein
MKFAEQFEEARRRYESFALPKYRPLHRSWVGLGYPSHYAKAVAAGLFTPLSGYTFPRVLSWYVLTPQGVEEYRKRFPGSEEGKDRKYRDGFTREEHWAPERWDEEIEA